MHVVGLRIVTAAVLGYIYNFSVDKYGNHKISQWTEEKIPLYIHKQKDIDFIPKTVQELRRTISKRSGIVEKVEDRKSWNAWLTSEEHPKEEIHFEPGSTYTFAYRSYSNHEEAGSIKKSLFHLKTLVGFIARKRGVMTIHEDGRHVTITDYFRMKGKRADCSWNGVIEGENERIVWTDTLLVIGKEKIVNPPQSEAMRTIPWEIVQMEDGMVAFQRGDIGMLVYDKNPVW